MKRKKPVRPLEAQPKKSSQLIPPTFPPPAPRFPAHRSRRRPGPRSFSLSALGRPSWPPSPNSISYLDRRMYIRNMEVLAHFGPASRATAKCR